MSETKQSELIRAAMEGIRDVVDSNTVLGKPFQTESGTTIIPVTRVSVGLATGGLDYFGKHKPAEKTDPAKLASFGGGGGTGITVSPVGFLVVRASGSVELLTVDGAANQCTAVSVIDAILDTLERSPEIAEKLKSVASILKKNKKEEQTPDA